MAEEITINIKTPSPDKISITVTNDKTVEELKDLIQAKTSVEKERQRLIYSGKVLKDNETIASYKILTGHTVHMVKGSPRTEGTGSSSASATAASAAASAFPTMAAGNAASDPLTALEGVQGHGFGGGTFNPFADGALGAGNLADPNAMMNMMNSPEFQQQMASQLANPAVVDQIIASNPQLQAMGPQVRQMLQSEHFRNMMTNPDTIRQMMQMQQMMQGGRGGSGPAAAFPPPGAFGTPPSGAGAAPVAGSGAPSLFGMTPQQMQQMEQMFGGGGGLGGLGGFGGLGGLGGGQAPLAAADARPAHERFASQLSTLQNMGFYDGGENIRALEATGGNVSAAVEWLLSHSPA